MWQLFRVYSVLKDYLVNPVRDTLRWNVFSSNTTLYVDTVGRVVVVFCMISTVLAFLTLCCV